MSDTEVCYTGGPAPPWLDQNAWYIPVAVPQEHIDKMPRIALHRVELKVNMCCKKCAEIVAEEIRYLGGVFDVTVDQKASKVTVTGRPDPDRVLKRARKVDKHATFWPPPPPPPPQPPAPPVVVVVVEEKPKEPEKPKEEEKPKEPEKPKEEEKPKEPEKPKEEEKPKEPEKPKEEEKPKEPEKPKEEEKPKEPEKPKEEEKPKEPEKPKEEEKPKEPEKPKEEPVAAAAAQFPPFQYSSYEGYPGPFGWEYRPSQEDQRLYPSDYNHMGYHGPSVPFMNPNYLKHVKIAY